MWLNFSHEVFKRAVWPRTGGWYLDDPLILPWYSKNKEFRTFKYGTFAKCRIPLTRWFVFTYTKDYKSIYIYMYIYIYVSIYIYIHIYLYLYLSIIYIYIYPSIHLSIYPSIHPSIHLSIHPSIHRLYPALESWVVRTHTSTLHIKTSLN